MIQSGCVVFRGKGSWSLVSLGSIAMEDKLNGVASMERSRNG